MAYRYPWYLGFYGDEDDDRDVYHDILEEDLASRGRDRRFRGVDYDHEGRRYAGGGYRYGSGFVRGPGVDMADDGAYGGPGWYGGREIYHDLDPRTDRYDQGRAHRRTVDRLRTWMNEGPHTGRGPEGYSRSEERILDDAHERLTRHGRLDASNISVRVDKGEITLEGTVDSRRHKRLAEDALETIPGVRDIHNRLRVEHI